MKAKRILGIGVVVVDHAVVLPAYPARDTKTTVEHQWRQIGGPVPVALSTAAFYGAETHFVGRWGNDAAGQSITEGLVQRGIDISLSQAQPEWTTGFAHVWIDPSGTRTIACCAGEYDPPNASSVRANQDVLRACKILHLDGAFPQAALAAAELMQQCGGRVVLDAGSKKPGMEELLPMVDVLVASDLFCERWYGRPDVSAKAIRELGCSAVVRTQASRGVSYDDGDLSFQIPAVKVDVLDTNGAGDVFSGALLYGLSQDWNRRRCVAFANAVAGSSCAARGNSTWPTLDEAVAASEVVSS